MHLTSRSRATANRISTARANTGGPVPTTATRRTPRSGESPGPWHRALHERVADSERAPAFVAASPDVSPGEAVSYGCRLRGTTFARETSRCRYARVSPTEATEVETSGEGTPQKR